MVFLPSPRELDEIFVFVQKAKHLEQLLSKK